MCRAEVQERESTQDRHKNCKGKLGQVALSEQQDPVG